MTVFSVQPTGRNDRENLGEIRLCLKKNAEGKNQVSPVRVHVETE